MEVINKKIMQAMFLQAYKNIASVELELSELDAAVGDGDHGTAIVTALKAACGEMEKDAPLNDMLSNAAFSVMSAASGSVSTLMGALLMGMGMGVSTNELNSSQTAAMFRAGLTNVSKQTQAKVGDKTLMDALIPAVEALEEKQNEGIESMFAGAAKAAREGANNTKDLVAKFGRGRNLGERVVGHLDPGAVSIAYIFESFAEIIKE